MFWTDDESGNKGKLVVAVKLFDWRFFGSHLYLFISRVAGSRALTRQAHNKAIASSIAYTITDFS